MQRWLSPCPDPFKTFLEDLLTVALITEHCIRNWPTARCLISVQVVVGARKAHGHRLRGVANEGVG